MTKIIVYIIRNILSWIICYSINFVQIIALTNKIALLDKDYPWAQQRPFRFCYKWSQGWHTDGIC